MSSNFELPSQGYRKQCSVPSVCSALTASLSHGNHENWKQRTLCKAFILCQTIYSYTDIKITLLWKGFQLGWLINMSTFARELVWGCGPSISSILPTTFFPSLAPEKELLIQHFEQLFQVADLNLSSDTYGLRWSKRRADLQPQECGTDIFLYFLWTLGLS